ncbi:MAG: nucleotidyltransferase family protein [Patescibacteria group bacterium]
MGIQEIKEKISPILEKYGIEKADIFGSFSRGEQTEKSDIDLMVRLGRPMGIFEFMGLKEDLMNTLGRDVDVVSEDSVDKFIKPYIIPDLKTVYER